MPKKENNVKFNYVEYYGKDVAIQIISEGTLTPTIISDLTSKEQLTTYLDISMLVSNKYKFTSKLEDDLVEKLIDKFGGDLYDISHCSLDMSGESLITYLVSGYFEGVDYTDIEDNNYNVRRIMLVWDKFEEYIPEMLKNKDDTVTIVKFSIV